MTAEFPVLQSLELMVSHSSLWLRRRTAQSYRSAYLRQPERMLKAAVNSPPDEFAAIAPSFNVYGYSAAQLLVKVLTQYGDDLNRRNQPWN